MNKDSESVVHLVQQSIRHIRRDIQAPGDVPIRVLIDRVEYHGNDDPAQAWWMIPVEVGTPKPRMYLVYEILDEVEQHLEDSESINVLLVPLVPDDQQQAA